jgi:hypothetical protein
MLRFFNGTTEPSGTDHGWLTFWPAEELEPASGPAAGDKDFGHLIVFADHGLSSWWYAIEAAREDGRTSRVYILAREPEVVSPSLEHFLRAAVEDDPILYGSQWAG